MRSYLLLTGLLTGSCFGQLLSTGIIKTPPDAYRGPEGFIRPSEFLTGSQPGMSELPRCLRTPERGDLVPGRSEEKGRLQGYEDKGSMSRVVSIIVVSSVILKLGIIRYKSGLKLPKPPGHRKLFRWAPSLIMAIPFR